MKIWLFSDLHLEIAPLRQPLAIPDADVCVVAGDLCRAPAKGMHWLAENIAHAMPCVYVAGNHEFYRGSIKEGLEDGRAAAARLADVHFLENDFVVIDSIRFVGATLWTDYRIDGHHELAMLHARERMNDHRKIAKQRNPWQRFVPETAYRMHMVSRRFIETALKGDPITTVVVTHHLPHARSIPSRFKGDLLNAAYASDLSEMIDAGRPALWVHGHTHESCDYRIGNARVVCNPRGYEDENSEFDPALVIDTNL
ncbi:MAG: phosphatase [Mesorhizobium sp.]|uniref:metallophosphoesterase n=1 Tax=Mesorhizobium captivum TaxID=3072319 RepID=UPI001205949B|nr:metallophosphoesterase [Mesorhizobium sp. VK22E]TIU90418.1 MAG: phosphatase [Mesorhizobium sp.]MDX8504720.1 metallophosphoesterase family protein [Mesorhizobium sp. VK22E]TIV23698.1 MAG: phosphatase [Mesorhizobium sp.]TIV64399.1 MAG: phosphatase [Mesorhizobium sp.]TIW05701.1 MAG: phosphatase [Mesorhizobium sp.]